MQRGIRCHENVLQHREFRAVVQAGGVHLLVDVCDIPVRIMKSWWHIVIFSHVSVSQWQPKHTMTTNGTQRNFGGGGGCRCFFCCERTCIGAGARVDERDMT